MYAQTEIQIQTCAQMRKGVGVRGGVTVVVNTKSIYGQTRLDTVATRVKPGYHTITVRTVGKGNFPSEWSCSRAARL